MSETESSYDFGEYREDFIEESPQQSQICAQSDIREDNVDANVTVSIQSSSVSQIVPPVDTLQVTFNQMDKEGRGFINKKVLQSTVMLTSHQYDRAIIKTEIDKCGDQIQYSRFIQIFKLASVADERVHEWLFELYDKERKGFIDQIDLRRASEITGVQLGEDEVWGMLMTQRNGGDGRVDFEDFKQLMEETIQYL